MAGFDPPEDKVEGLKVGWKAYIYKSSIVRCSNCERSHPMPATEENQWEFTVERQLPLKRWHAYRVAVDRMEEWWWHPSSRPVTEIRIGMAAGSPFKAFTDNSSDVQEGIVLSVRPGWFFHITDALHGGMRPATPSMVGSWTFGSATGGFARHVARIRHFSEADYSRNLDRGLERRWNEAADKLVALCEEGIGAIKRHRV
ncbi:hypothetical protein [Qipengyuania sp. JC766]|uniref:hypothetical protein n=1 Tax=Qipengyuania sp. JC766 TaxID=3232139 RepID=UPI003459875D